MNKKTWVKDIDKCTLFNDLTSQSKIDIKDNEKNNTINDDKE